MPLYCGCCDCGAVDKQHFDTTEHHLKALEEWCRLLNNEHGFEKGNLKDNYIAFIFKKEILLSQMTLRTRAVSDEEIEKIIRKHLDFCKKCFTYMPKDVKHCMWDSKVKKSGMCPDCFYGNKVTHDIIDGGS